MMAIADKTVPELRFPEFEEDWQRKPLKALSSKSISYGIVQTGVPVEGGVKCVRVVDLTKPRIDFNELITTSDKISQSYKKTILGEDEIMVALRGEIGLVAAVPKELEGSNLTRGIARIAPKGSEVHSSYLLWALRAPEGRKEFHRQVNGSALKEIPIGGLNKIPVQLTSLPEQRKIADFLTAVDGRIGQLIQKKALLEDYKKGVMQRLFATANGELLMVNDECSNGSKINNSQLKANHSLPLRFKDDQGYDFPDWEEKKLGEVYSYITTNSLSRDNLNYESGEVFNIHYGDIHTKFRSHFYLSKENVPYLNDSAEELRIKDECYVRAGDIVLADASEDYADIGKSIEILDTETQQIVAGLHTYILRPDLTQMAIGFGAYLLQARPTRLGVMTVAQGTKVLGLPKGYLAGITLNIPTPDEQTKIANFLSALDRKIESVATQITETQTFKRGLLQQMFV